MTYFKGEQMRRVRRVSGVLMLGGMMLMAATGVLAEEQMHQASAVSKELEQIKTLA